MLSGILVLPLAYGKETVRSLAYYGQGRSREAHRIRILRQKIQEVLVTTVSVFGIGSARWPDGPPQSGVAQELKLIPVSGVGEAVGGISEAVGDEKIGGNGVGGTSTKT